MFVVVICCRSFIAQANYYYYYYFSCICKTFSYTIFNCKTIFYFLLLFIAKNEIIIIIIFNLICAHSFKWNFITLHTCMTFYFFSHCLFVFLLLKICNFFTINNNKHEMYVINISIRRKCRQKFLLRTNSIFFFLIFFKFQF